MLPMVGPGCLSSERASSNAEGVTENRQPSNNWTHAGRRRPGQLTFEAEKDRFIRSAPSPAVPAGELVAGLTAPETSWARRSTDTSTTVHPPALQAAEGAPKALPP